MVIERLSRLPRKLMPRMFKGFTGKQTARTVSAPWSTAAFASTGMIYPPDFRQQHPHPDFSRIHAELSHISRLPQSILPTRVQECQTLVHIKGILP